MIEESDQQISVEIEVFLLHSMSLLAAEFDKNSCFLKLFYSTAKNIKIVISWLSNLSYAKSENQI